MRLPVMSYSRENEKDQKEAIYANSKMLKLGMHIRTSISLKKTHSSAREIENGLESVQEVFETKETYALSGHFSFASPSVSSYRVG